MIENHNPEHMSEKAKAYMYRNWEHRASRIKHMNQPAATISAVLAKGVPYGIFYPDGKESNDIMDYNVTPQLPSNGLKVAELFCGGGLMAIGLKSAGYNIVFANDFEKKAVEAYKHNLGDHVVHGDITDEAIQSLIPDVDIIAGGPPCQDYSVAGTGDGEAGSRGKLVWTYLQIIENKQPKAFIFENVKGLITKKHLPTFEALLKEFDKIGYTVSWKLINAWDYGVAQKRERVFIVGVRKDLGFTFKFPEPFPEDYRTQVLRDVIGDLPEPQEMVGKDVKKPEHKASMDGPSPTITTQFRCQSVEINDDTEHPSHHNPKPLSDKAVAYIHSKDGRSLKKHRPPEMHEPSQTIVSNLYKGVPYGLFYPDNHERKVISDKALEGYERRNAPGGFGLRVNPWEEPSPTIFGRIFNEGKAFVHPETQPQPRRFTVRECLRIQSVPDYYVFPDSVSVSAQYKVVGNGVASRVAYLIGNALAEQINAGGHYV